MAHYGTYTHDITAQFLKDLRATGCDIDMHLNRTRFWLDPSLEHHVEFYLKYSHIMHAVHPDEDLASGVRW